MDEQNYQQKITKLEQELTDLKANYQDKSLQLEKDIFSLESTFTVFSNDISNNKQKQQKVFIPILRATGYALLILTLIDYTNTFINFRLFNPEIELQTIAILVNNSPSALMGIALLFYEKQYSNKIEKIALKIISWLCLIVGIGYLLLIPVNISASLMINNASIAQVNNAVSQQSQPLDTLKEKLNQAQSDEDIIKLIQDPKNKQPVKITNPQEVKKQAIANITKAEEQLNQQSVAQKQQQTTNLLKNSIKYILGCLVCGVFFIYICWITKKINPVI